MKKIFYTDISDIKLQDINLSLITKERIDKANSINNELKKIQSLASYLLLRYAFKTFGVDITDRTFSYNANKPFIEGLGYTFNISHSHNIVTVVISDEDVGIDCEMVDATRNLSLLKSYLFTTKETTEFDLISYSEKYDYFYQKWVMKEAYFKMNGTGLTKKFKDVTLDYEVHFIKDLTGKSYCVSSTIDTSTVLIDFNTINH